MKADPTRYFLGLPAWAFPGWRDRYFTNRPSTLASYAQVFNAVEGNTTFYGVPDARTIDGWRAAAEGTGLKICFKLPQTVTHGRHADRGDLRAFLAAVEPLGEHLGPLLVQFPARVGPAELDFVGGLLAALPVAHRKVVEVRHPQFFSSPELLEPLLDERAAGRVVLDARAIHEGDRGHPEVIDALHEKPDLPVLPRVHHGLAFTRLVLHPDRVDNQRYIDEWAARYAEYLALGHEVYMMIHCPNNLHCPELAASFHGTLRRLPGGERLPELSPWPVPRQAALL